MLGWKKRGRVGSSTSWELDFNSSEKLNGILVEKGVKREKSRGKGEKSWRNWREKASFQKTNFTLMEKVFNIRTQSVGENVEEWSFKNSLGNDILLLTWVDNHWGEQLLTEPIYIYTYTHRELWYNIYVVKLLVHVSNKQITLHNNTCLTHS